MSLPGPAGSLERLRRLLRCPECHTALAFEAVETQPLADGLFGVLSCGRHAYPVIDSIPVIRRGRVDVQDHTSHRVDVVGPSVHELVHKVDRDPLDALVDLLVFPPPLPFGLGRVRVVRGVVRLPGVARLAQPTSRSLRSRRALIRARIEQLDAQTAQDWLELFYLRSRVADEYYPYFLTRFSQPRYLASLSLTSMLRRDDTPVLDLACGFGHLMYHLGARPRSVHCVGIDRNFFQIWVARRWIARSADFICADALEPLPFLDGAFSVSICTDAFHLLPERERCLAELKRCARAETVILDRIGNGRLKPRDVAWESTPEEYLDLVGPGPSRMVAETELVDCYQRGSGPKLGRARDAAEFARDKWISIVASRDVRFFVDHGPLDGIPHAAGPLGVNPMYVPRHVNGGVRLTFRFPSKWHAFENQGMLAYHAPEVTLSQEEFEAARNGRVTALTDELVRQFVVIGMPETYLRVSDF